MKLLLLVAIAASVVALCAAEPSMLSDEFIEVVRSKAKTWTVSYSPTFPLFSPAVLC